VRIIALASLALWIGACGGESPAPSPPTPSSVENAPPEILSVTIWPMEVTAADRISVSVDARDPDRDSLEIEVEWYINGILHHSGPEFAMPHTQLVRGDELYAVAYVSDGDSETTLESDSVRVANQPPRLDSLELLPVTAGGTDNLMAVAKATDPEGDSIQFVYEWYLNGGLVEDVTAAVMPSNRFHRGDEIAVRVSATDGVDVGPAAESTTLEIKNSPPVISSEPSYGLAGAALYEYEVRAEDPDGDAPLRYDLKRGPDGMSIDLVTGLIRWSLPQHAAGVYEIELTVSDPHGGVTSQRYSLDVSWEEPVPASASNAGPDEQVRSLVAP
jgi:hypothetical protein